MKTKSLRPLLLSLVIIFLFSCSENEKTGLQGRTGADLENQFFTLDFSNNDYDMSDIESFFFTTFPHDDPTQGDVVYDRKKWINSNMIELVNGDGLYLYIKSRTDSAFDSFRLTTKTFFNLDKDNRRILFVFKGKLPSAKGIWPAWWLNGGRQDPWIYKNATIPVTNDDLDSFSGKGHFYNTPSAVNVTDWPSAGEVDIIENINGDTLIHNTIHTCPQMCDSEWNSDGQLINCANAREGDPNAGCSGQPYAVQTPEGTFACLWSANNFKFYYWPAHADVRATGGPLSTNPRPESWQNSALKNEVHLRETEAECNSNEHQNWQCAVCAESSQCVFNNMKMIFNTTLCGKWAGNKFDDSQNALQNCRSFIFSEGKQIISNQFMKIEYVSVSRI